MPQLSSKSWWVSVWHIEAPTPRLGISILRSLGAALGALGVALAVATLRGALGVAALGGTFGVAATTFGLVTSRPHQ